MTCSSRNVYNVLHGAHWLWRWLNLLPSGKKRTTGGFITAARWTIISTKHISYLSWKQYNSSLTPKHTILLNDLPTWLSTLIPARCWTP